MAGAFGIKRVHEMDALQSPSKRFCCVPFQQSNCNAIVANVAANTPYVQPRHPSSFASTASNISSDEIALNVKEEAHRVSRRKKVHIAQAVQAVQAVQSAQSRSEFEERVLAAQKSGRALFTADEVATIVAAKLQQQESQLREEYERTLRDKMAEQYDTFVKFTHDQIQQKFKADDCPSYMS